MKQFIQALPQRITSLSPRAERVALVGWTLAVLAVALALLLLPGKTYIGRYSHDMLIFFDDAHRVLGGQVPNRDFHSPLGPLALLLPAFGLWLSGSLGGMFPVATAAFALIVTPILIYTCRRRLPLPHALGFALYTLILVIAPLNPGEPVEALTFAMFYNRFCWALLGLLFLYALPARGPSRPVADGLTMAALLLLMFYLKISYAAFGLVFTLLFLIFPHGRRAALVALGAALAAAAIVALLWGGTGTYLADIGMAAQASGAVRGTLFTLSRTVLENLTACLLLLSILILAFVRGARWDYLLLASAMGGIGIILLNQNAQPSGILTFVPAGLVVALAPRRPVANARPSPGLGIDLLLLTLAVPFVLTATVALCYHSVKALRAGGGDPKAEIQGLYVSERAPDTSPLTAEQIDQVYRRGSADLTVLNKVGVAGLPEGDRSYFHTIHDGIALLRSNPALGGKTFAFEMASPFNALLGRESPRGIDAWNHAGRTFSTSVYRPPEQMFADVDVVMIPRKPRTLGTTEQLEQVYGRFVRSHYRLAATSTYWEAWARPPRR